jgi:hypothetical protein
LSHGYDEAEAMVRRRPAESAAVCFGAGVLTGLVVALLIHRKRTARKFQRIQEEHHGRGGIIAGHTIAESTGRKMFHEDSLAEKLTW